MGKLLNGGLEFSTIRQLLESVNQTTDDFLFIYDIKKNKNQFFGSISRVFALGTPEHPVCTSEEMLAIVHPADRKTVAQEFGEICRGHKDFHNQNFRMFNRNGEIVWVSSRGKLLCDNDGMPAFVLGRLSEEAVRHLFNPVTSLWNKTKLREDLKNRLKSGPGWLMMLEIPELNDINLSRGRSVGDHLLCDVADTFVGIEPIEETYHIDYNKFSVVLEDISEETVKSVYHSIAEALKDKCALFAGVVPIDAAVFLDESQLIDSAHITMKKASQNPGEGIEFFSAEELQMRIASLMLLEEMKESVQNGFDGFEVYYQPQIKSGSYALYGVEALLRYQSPKRGVVFPDEFIPLLEQSGLIHSVGMWVLETALAQCKEWRESLPSLQMAVNFSFTQFEDRSLGEKIVAALKNAGLPGNALTVELTESVQLSGDKHYYRLLEYIKAYGVRFAIDDFGTGYSNLGYLKKLDVNEIKIDRSFVSEIEENTYNYRLITNVIEFAKTNSIHACFEGVETARELSILEPLQADIFQGYLFDKPCTSEEITQKYICSSSDAYKARMASLEEIHRFKEQFGTIHFNPKNILRANDIGLWMIHIDEKSQRYELHGDEVMESVLGLADKLSPEECYRHWYSRIPEAEVEYVRCAVDRMIKGGRAVQLSYRWNHPEIGEVTVRCSGIRTQNENGQILLEGYHRILTGVDGAWDVLRITEE